MTPTGTDDFASPPAPARPFDWLALFLGVQLAAASILALFA